MRIELRRRDGSHTSIRQRLAILDTGELPESERRLVERLVTECGLLSSSTPRDGTMPDAFGYTFVIEDAPGHRYEVTTPESDLSPPLGKLVAMLVERGGKKG